MCRKLMFSVSCVLFLCIAANVTKAELIAYWPFDEGSGDIAADVIGGNDAQITGATWTTASMMGTAAIDVASSTIDCGPGPTPTTEDLTLAWWMIDNHNSYGTLLSKSAVDSTKGYNLLTRQGEDSPLRFRIGGWQAYGGWGEECRLPDGAFADGQWVHITCTYDSATDTATMYVNGELKENGNLNPKTGIAGVDGYCEGLNNPDEPLYIVGNPETFTGVIDEVAIWDSALTPDEVLNVFEKGPQAIDKRMASSPIPEDGASDIPHDLTLTWTPGETAVTRDVFVATSFEDANNASVTDPLGTRVGQDLSDSEWNPGPLAFGQTYFWRVDEANGVPDNTVFKGNVWNFEVEPVSFVVPIGAVTATASSMDGVQDPNNTVNGVGLDPNTGEHSAALETMWSGAATDIAPWIQFKFEKVEKLDKMLVWNHNTQTEAILGFGIKEALIEYSVDGDTWSELGTVELAQAPGIATYTGEEVALDMIVATYVKITALSNYSILGLPQKGLAEVRFYAVPMQARREIPATGTTGVDPLVDLSWRAGREAVKHEVLMGTDPNNLSLVATVTDAAYTAAVDMGTAVYWQVNEINDAMDPAAWEGNVWSLDTTEYITVDNMESYKSQEGSYVWETWVDGFGDDNNGALLGHGGDDMETDAAYDGSQSLPYYYGQGGASNSEAFRDIERDWGQHGIVSLSLMFQGDPANTPGQMYIKVNDDKIATYPVSSDLTIPQWFAWTIDLPASALGHVKSLAIGFAGGTGLVFIDAIRLYDKASETLSPQPPSDADLLAHYPFEGNYNDASGNGWDGTPVDNPSILNDPVRGQILSLDGFAACVELGASNAFNPQGDFSISVWANTSDFVNNWGHVIIAKRGENNLGWQLRRHSSTPNLTFTLRGTTGADDPQGSVSMEPFYGEWVHIAAVYDMAGGQRTVYVNGLLDVSIEDTSVVASTDHNVYIGARANSGNTGPEAFFGGMLDEIKLYNRPLSQGEALGLAGRTEPIFKEF